MSDSLRPHGLLHARLPCPSLSLKSLLKVMSIESAMPSNHLILCCSLLLLPSVFPSIRVFSNESVLRIRWPKYGASASALVLSVNIQGRFALGLTGLISLLSKGLLSLLQPCNSKASILQHSAFFIVFYFVFKILFVAQSGSACESPVMGKPQLSTTCMTSYG